MAKQTVDLAGRLKVVVAERTKLEGDLAKAQAKLRGIDRQADPDAYAAQLAHVNAAKAEIGRVSAKHVELAQAISLVSGGTNHQPLA